MLWQCPICASPLLSDNTVPHATGVHCSNHHHFDRAKQGYIHLLPPQHKRSKSPGDSKAMISSRHRFLNSGAYAALSEAINQTAIQRLSLSRSNHMAAVNSKNNRHSEAFNFLDLGCGEGYFCANMLHALTTQNALQQQHHNHHHNHHQNHHHQNIHGYGVDISKEGIKLAARQYHPNIHFAVASNFKLPLLAKQFDLVIQVLAPADNKEITRVLKPKGTLIKVTPGPNHLQELRNAIYKEGRQHSKKTIDADFFTAIGADQRICTPIALETPAIIEDLISMTPYQWHGNTDAKSQLIHSAPTTLTVDFILQQLTPAPSETSDQ